MTVQVLTSSYIWSFSDIPLLIAGLYFLLFFPFYICSDQILIETFFTVITTLFLTWLLQTPTGDARPEGQSRHTTVSAQELQESLHTVVGTSLKAPPEPGADCAPCSAQVLIDSQ